MSEPIYNDDFRNGTLVSLLNFDVGTNVTIPEDMSAYYRIAEFFYLFTIVGTAIDKQAEYPIVGLTIESEDPANQATAEEVVRKIQLKQKAIRVNRDYLLYGLGAMFPMYPVKKFLECKACGKAYVLSDLVRAGKPTYRYMDGEYFYKCNNKNVNGEKKQCPNYGIDSKMKVRQQEIKDVNKLLLSVWNPNRLTNIHNTFTDEKVWIYQLDPQMKTYIDNKNHHIICTTPQEVLIPYHKHQTLQVNGDKLFVMEAPTLQKKGIPIPPMVRAMQGLYQMMRYQSANRLVADDMLVPLKIVFPKSSAELNRPIAASLVSTEVIDRIRKEINLWKDARKAGKEHIPIIPIEVDFRYAWGEGKLFALNTEIRACIQDILATIGTPLEFIYGGATWSRQNISAIILENRFKVLASYMQDVLDYVASEIDKSTPNNKRTFLKLEVPVLVEAMGMLPAVERAKAEGDVSLDTYLGMLGLNARREAKKIRAEEAEVLERRKRSQKNIAIAQLEGQEVMSGVEAINRSVNRKQMMLDSLVQDAIEQDAQQRQMNTQRAMYEMQRDMQAASAEIDRRLQEQAIPLQMETLRQNLNLQRQNQIQTAKEMGKVQIKGMIDQSRAQMKIQKEMSKEEQLAQLEQAFDPIKTAVGITPEQDDMIGRMKTDEKIKTLTSIIEAFQMQQIKTNLPPEQAQQLNAMHPEQQEQYLRQLMQDQQNVDPEQQAAEQQAQEHQQQAIAQQATEIQKNQINHEQSIEKEQIKHQADKEKMQMTHEQSIEKAKQEQELEAAKEQERIAAMAETYTSMKPRQRAIYEQELLKDPSTFAKVKIAADALNIQKYTALLLNVPSKANEILEKAKKEHPELMDKIYHSMEQQLFFMQQASGWAYKLMQTNGTEAYQPLVDKLISETPPEFREMVVSEFEKLRNNPERVNPTKKTLVDDDAYIQEVAHSVNAMDLEEKQRALQTMKYESEGLYRKIMPYLENE